LVNTEIFEEYCTLFETLITGFLVTRNMDIHEFYKIVREEYQLVETGKNKMPISVTIASVLTSLTDYFSFCEMMYEVNNGGEVIFCPPLIDCDEYDLGVAESKNDSGNDSHAQSCKGDKK
jgi:hypothetical protein